MKVTILIVCIYLAPIIGFAHDADKAFYEIIIDDGAIEVKAEFPWTIRNALLQFAPQLRVTKSQEEYDSAFFEYVKTNLILTNASGNQLELISIESIVANGHSHQNDFKFVFDGKSVHSISNSILFNLKNNQENIHSLITNGNKIEFIMSESFSTYKVPIEFKASLYSLWLLLLLTVPAGLLINKSRTKQPNL